MAVTRSPYGDVTTIVPHFKVKNTLLKNGKRKFKKKKNAQFSFCGGREAFHQEIVHRAGVSPVVSPGRTLRLAWRTTAHRVVLNLPCVQPIVLGCRIHDPGSVMRTGLKDKVLDFE